METPKSQNPQKGFLATTCLALIWHLPLTPTATATLVHSFVASSLDYCSCFYTGLLATRLRVHPFMTTMHKKIRFLTHLSTCVHMGRTPLTPLWTSTRVRHEIHTALLKWLVQ